MKSLLLTVAMATAVALTACQTPSDTGTITQDQAEIIVHNNLGGHLAAFRATRSRYEASGKRVVISGYCASACTILYSLPNACMEKGSSLHFHGAFNAFGASASGNRQLASFYRAGIKDAFLADWRKIKPDAKMRRLNREAAIKLDPSIKRCEEVTK